VTASTSTRVPDADGPPRPPSTSGQPAADASSDAPASATSPTESAPAASESARARTARRRRTDTQVLPIPDLDDDDEPPPRPGRAGRDRIGSYRVLKALGRGGMGTVWLGEAAESCPVPRGRQVAIKVLRNTDDEERRRFAREAHYLQSLQHPGIVRVLDSGEHKGRPFLVMQFVDGQRLDDLVLDNPLEPRRAAVLAVQALEALHVAHLAGILHRDIKPGNIMVDRQGNVKILDFGLASHLHHESRLTRTGNVVGTPAYMSPEQASGTRGELSQRADIYGMGACLYELLTGFQPFTADNSMALLRRIIDDPLTPPSRLRPDLPRDLETVVLVAMAKEARDRYPSAEAMAADLRRFLRGEKIRARRLSPITRGARWTWRHRRALAASTLVVFLLGSGGGIALHRVLREIPPPAKAAPDPAIANDWTIAWRCEGALDKAFGIQSRPAPALGKDLRIAALPPAEGVEGPVRLTAVATLTEPEAEVDLLVSDRDIGRGYRLRLEGGANGDRLVLLREDKVVSSQDLGRVARGQPWRLVIEREDATLTARLNDQPPLRFLDLVPIEGHDACGAFIAAGPGATVRNVVLERQRRGLYVSALERGDILRQDGRFALAQQEYEGFLRDHPEAREARDARLRIALCMEAQKDDEHALTRFLDLAADLHDQPGYALVATFHAWGCALRLGRYEDAERLFEGIRRSYDLPTLVSTVPEDTLNSLLRDYLDRAEQLSTREPERAARLYTTAADLAGYLKISAAIGQGRTGAGDVLLGLGQIEQAKALYFSAATDQRLGAPLRMKAMLKVAEADRMADQTAWAEAGYGEVIATPTPPEDYSPWARLWLGDLQLEEGHRELALATWKQGAEATPPTPASRIMACLVAGSGPLPTTDDRYFANDIAYFQSRLALLAGDLRGYHEGLRTVVGIGPDCDWPSPLAKHLLVGIPDEPAKPAGQTPAPAGGTPQPAGGAPQPATVTPQPAATP
jgi:serine/threonine protein kinase/tetratricopeptide (TPR) repeat protein